MCVTEERYWGSLRQKDVLKPPEGFIPGLGHIYVVMGSGASDIGKGWLAASIASLLEDPLVVKIDPMLNGAFPNNIGMRLGTASVSDDFQTYKHFGLEISPEQNLIMGKVLRDFMVETETPPLLAPGKEKKLTHADVSEFTAQRIIALMKKRQPRNVVIEIGGIPEDSEHVYLLGALRLLGVHSLVVPEIVMLSFFNHVNLNGRDIPKNQVIKNGVKSAMRKYAGLLLKAIFVRRNHVPLEISDDELRTELERIAHETQIAPEKFIFLDNVDSVDEEREIVEQSGVFTKEDSPVMISACVLGLPCRYNGASKPVGRDLNMFLSNGQALLLCPEMLAGLPTPRGPFNVIGGTGEDVLNGTARVIDGDGRDVTSKFINGAVATLKACLSNGVRKAVLRERSPSCGVSQLVGADGELYDGSGVTAALLRRWGIEVIPADSI